MAEEEGQHIQPKDKTSMHVQEEAVLGAGDASEDDSANGEGLHVHTAVADERAAALQALAHYAQHCGPAFLPYAEDAMSLCQAATGAGCCAGIVLSELGKSPPTIRE